MSCVIDTVLIFDSFKAEEKVAELNAIINEGNEADDYGQHIRLVPSSAAGGSKVMSSYVALAGFNYWDIWECVQRVKWDYPDSVILMTRTEEVNEWTVRTMSNTISIPALSWGIAPVT